jgi:hypothetical protein
LTEDKKLEGGGSLGETKLKIENRGLLGVSSNDIEAMERGCCFHAVRGERRRRLPNFEIDVPFSASSGCVHGEISPP